MIVKAPARLHFGLFSVGGDLGDQFGGVGLMIEQPSTVICATHSDHLVVVGQHASTVRAVVEKWYILFRDRLGTLPRTVAELPVQLEIRNAAPRHVGLGSGTQLALSSATALCNLFSLATPRIEELAAMLGRGRRSAIGTYGFRHGGLLVDSGKSSGQTISALATQLDFPDHWPIVLALLAEQQGRFGIDEDTAFANLKSCSNSERQSMIELARREMVPAVQARDYDWFANSIHEFGKRSGQMFKPIQGGAFQGPQVARLVERIRDSGVGAVGQSSWGPCVFAITRDNHQAVELRQYLDSVYQHRCHVEITCANNVGCREYAQAWS